MKKMMVGFGSVAVSAMLALGVYAATQSTGTTLTDTVTSTKDLLVYQDYSSYPGTPGQAGKIVRFYDFDKLGGTAGSTVKLLPAVTVKDNTLIRNGYVKIMDGIDPVGAITNSIQINTTGDLVAAATNLYHTIGLAAVVPVGTAATSVQATNDLYITFTIGTVAITNGKFMVVLDAEMVP